MTSNGGILLRRHVAQRLADYYAQPSNLVVGAASSSVDYRNLFGEWHWKRTYRRWYQEQQGQWLTPVELFAPYYSQVLAEYCIATNIHDTDFEIVELGGGRGTNASGILTHLQQSHPDAYERLSRYTIVDSSPTLHELQQERLSKDHASKLRFELKDLTNVAERQTELVPSSTSSTPTLFLALELLDNLGHDKVRRDALSRKLEHAVVTSGGEEVFQPLSDPLLKQVLLKLPSYGGTMGQPTWVPSVACGVLMEMVQARPQCHVVLADFDYLPPPDIIDEGAAATRSSIWAQGEPLVTDMEGLDHECYLTAPHLVDILYPTDFGKLHRFTKKLFKGGEARVTKQGKFLFQHGPEQVEATTSRWTGYSPMIHDFFNCSVLTATTMTSTRNSSSEEEEGKDKSETTVKR